MTEISYPNGRSDREYRYRSLPPRYPTVAAPDETVVEWAHTVPGGSSIVDIGCGQGQHLVYLGERGFWMSGIDQSPDNLRISKNMCDQRGLPFEGHVADMYTLPWGEGTFDAALSTSTICHHLRQDIVKIISEVWRILRPGGFLLVDFLHKETLTYQLAHHQVIRGKLAEVEPGTFAAECAGAAHSDPAFRCRHYSDEAEVRDLLSSFEILKLRANLSPRPMNNSLPRQGYWVVWARKPVSKITRMILSSTPPAL